MLDQWAYLNGVELDFSRPGTPTDNAFAEAFDSRVRAELLSRSGIGAGGGNRTPDIQLGKLTFYL